MSPAVNNLHTFLIFMHIIFIYYKPQTSHIRNVVVVGVLCKISNKSINKIMRHHTTAVSVRAAVKITITMATEGVSTARLRQ